LWATLGLLGGDKAVIKFLPQCLREGGDEKGAALIRPYTKHQKEILIIEVTSLAIFILLAYFFIPLWGIVGSAVAMLTILTLGGVVKVFLAKHLLGLDTPGFYFLRIFYGNKNV
jgi:hypothetical protein